MLLQAPVWCMRNTMVRLISRTILIVLGCFIACLLPFFGDIMGFIGAIGFTPMDFILPQFLWIAAYKPKGPKKWFALLVAGIYTIIGIMAAIGAVRSIVNNAVTYHLFANL
jgi:amino acid permease